MATRTRGQRDSTTRRILVPYDASPRSERALNYACASFPEDVIVALHVLTRSDLGGSADSWIDSPDAFEEWASSQRDGVDSEVFDGAIQIADEYEVSLDTALAVGPVRRAVVDYWTQQDFDFLVMDVKGTGFRRVLDFLTGDVNERLSRAATRPAVLVNDRMDLPRERQSDPAEWQIIVPLEKTVRSRNALEFACSTFPEADITVLCMYVVWGADRTVVLDRVESPQERLAEIVATAERIAAEADTTVSTVFGYGAVDRAVLQYIDGHPTDLAVLGTPGRATLSELSVPSASERLLRNSPIPLAVVPTPAPP